MKQIYTEDDVIRYVYGEMDEEEYPVFFEVLCKDPELWQMFESFQQVKSELGEALYSPSEATTVAIMEEVNRFASHSNQNPEKSPSKHNSRFTLFPAGIVLGLFIAGVGIALQQVFFSTAQPHTADISPDDHAWMYDRLYRMEDDRVLPEFTGSNAYQLVRYSGTGYAREATVRFK